MSTEHRSLLMRANRLLGSALVDHNLIKIEDLEKANERLLEVMAGSQARQSTVLGILAYEMKVVREDDVLQHVVDSEGVGLVDLRNYDTSDDIKKALDAGACWATWSVPFDREEDFYFIATAYYLSPAVRSFWEKQFGAQIVWYGTTLDVIADYLEKLELERSNATAAAGGTRSPFSAPGSKAPFPAAAPPAAPKAAPTAPKAPAPAASPA
jgi:hypothetical protein